MTPLSNMKPNLMLIVILFLSPLVSSQAETTNNQSSTVVFVNEGSSLKGSPFLVYHTYNRSNDFITVINTATEERSKFRAPEMTKTSVLMKEGICAVCYDGKIVLFTTSGSRRWENKIDKATILKCLRISDDKLAVIGSWPSEERKGFDLTLKVVLVHPDGISTKEIGSVPKPGALVSPDECTVCWVRGKEVKCFSVCE